MCAREVHQKHAGCRKWNVSSSNWKRDLCRLVIAEAMIARQQQREAFFLLQKLVQAVPHSTHVWNLYCRWGPPTNANVPHEITAALYCLEISGGGFQSCHGL